jgi:hypothetical protein
MLANYKIPLSQYFNHPPFQLKGCPGTESYRTDNFEDLQKELEKYHPLR